MNFYASQLQLFLCNTIPPFAYSPTYTMSRLVLFIWEATVRCHIGIYRPDGEVALLRRRSTARS